MKPCTALMGRDTSRPVPFADEDDRPTQRQMLRRCRYITATCAVCLGTGLVLFQWFGEQPCSECDGTGRTHE